MNPSANLNISPFLSLIDVGTLLPQPSTSSTSTLSPLASINSRYINVRQYPLTNVGILNGPMSIDLGRLTSINSFSDADYLWEYCAKIVRKIDDNRPHIPTGNNFSLDPLIREIFGDIFRSQKTTDYFGFSDREYPRFSAQYSGRNPGRKMYWNITGIRRNIRDVFLLRICRRIRGRIIIGKK
jgi:hypothetical protein